MIDTTSLPSNTSLEKKIDDLWAASGKKILSIEQTLDVSRGAPVYTVRGQYTPQAWTEWTEGFQIGAALLQFDATGEEVFLEMGRRQTLECMPSHVAHFGVHDHGFTNISTYGTLLRLVTEKKVAGDTWQRACYEMALRCSGAVQAHRWTSLKGGDGYIYSFNGPHSLFADTIRSLRSLAVAHRLGGVLKCEGDERVSLLDRLMRHARTTAKYTVYYGQGRDGFDVRGRIAHESIFNTSSGRYRCPGTQQGYSPYSTWTRGLAWIICGYAELLEFIASLSASELAPYGGHATVSDIFCKAAKAACDYYIGHTPTCGVPYWDTGAPGLHNMGNYLQRSADPFNDHEPVDSSAAAIAAQGLLRLGHYLNASGGEGDHYWHAGIRIADTLFSEPYLHTGTDHQGLLLHSVYHHPNRWDYVPLGRSVPCGESTMWGDYHTRELALYLRRILRGEPYLTFFTVLP